MTALAITRGLPASGKTTLARDWVSGRPAGTAARVNRDDLRHNLFGVYWGLTYEQEERVSVAQRASVSALLKAGVSVIVDDTNLAARYAKAWRRLALECGAEFEIHDLPVPPGVCVARDRMRVVMNKRGVGAEAIWGMADRYAIKEDGALPVLEDDEASERERYEYEPDPKLPRAWMVDIDGTLAHSTGRGPFDWARVGEDTVDGPVKDLMGLMHPIDDVVLMSGRDSICRDATENWLRRNEVSYDVLFMRPHTDTRKDAVVKLELFRTLVAPRWHVRGVIDDRDQVVAMWRSIGLVCFQAYPGAF